MYNLKTYLTIINIFIKLNILIEEYGMDLFV